MLPNYPSAVKQEQYQRTLLCNVVQKPLVERFLDRRARTQPARISFRDNGRFLPRSSNQNGLPTSFWNENSPTSHFGLLHRREFDAFIRRGGLSNRSSLTVVETAGGPFPRREFSHTAGNITTIIWPSAPIPTAAITGRLNRQGNVRIRVRDRMWG